MKKGVPIQEQDLDKLLNQLFLEKNAGTADADLAEFVMEKNYPVKTNAQKEQQLMERLNKNAAGSSSGFSIYLSCLAFVLISVSLYFALQKNSTAASAPQKKVAAFQSILTPAADTNTYVALYAQNKIKTKPNIQETFTPVILPELIKLKYDSIKPLQANQVLSETKKTEESLPLISETDKQRFKKIKGMMLERLYKLDKKTYTHVDAEKVSYKDSDIVVEAFSIRNFSVTNLEYKTFLAELIQSSRKEDYFSCAVLSGNWNNYQCPNLYASYFTDEKYNDFPVVNIPAEGAIRFCRWLEEELQLYIKQNALKARAFKLRLPMDIEWIYAAWSGYTKIPYASGYNTIFDTQEGFVDDEFSKRIYSIGKKVKRIDTLYDLLNINMFGWSEKQINEMLQSGFSRFSNAPSDTIYPERMKVYTKTNHVSEMVFQRRSERMWLVGAAWKSKEEYLKMANDFTKYKASPFAGFRFVVVNEKDPTYKNPFW